MLMAIFDRKFAQHAGHGKPLPNAKALDSMGAMLSAILAMESAQRGGNWIKSPGSSAMPVRTKDIRFQVGSGETSASTTQMVELIGTSARTMLHGLGDDRIDLSQVKRVKEIQINILSTKQGHPVINQKIARRTEEEAVVLEAVVTWLLLSGTKDDDPFLTRYAATPKTNRRESRRLITAKDRSMIVKDCAREAGLDENHFSATSLRKGSVTVLSEVLGTEEAAKRSGHNPRSKVITNHYDFSRNGALGNSVGPSALSRTDGFGVEQLKSLMPSSTREQGEVGKKEGEKGQGKYWVLEHDKAGVWNSGKQKRKRTASKRFGDARESSSKR
jgi:hypothetical protein